MWDLGKFLLHFSRDAFFREHMDFLDHGPFRASLAQSSPLFAHVKAKVRDHTFRQCGGFTSLWDLHHIRVYYVYMGSNLA